MTNYVIRYTVPGYQFRCVFDMSPVKLFRDEKREECLKQNQRVIDEFKCYKSSDWDLFLRGRVTTFVSF